MKNKIYPCLWLDGQAEAAAQLYCRLFGNSKIVAESNLVVQIELEETKVMLLNGGPVYKINPSISLFVTCTTNEEIERLWHDLSDGGFAMMPLDSYPWCEKYGWLADKFGMTWQLFLGDLAPGQQKIIPLMLFVGEQFGKAEEAMKSYASIFHNSGVIYSEYYTEGEGAPAGSLKFGRFNLGSDQLAAMDGPGEHAFLFDAGVSFVVECENQEEIDFTWDKLTEGGSEVQCGWLTDRYGVSWQIIPRILGELMSDPIKGERVMKELLKMKKLDIQRLLEA
jgi:predicted 3-demethylubiquinone-9 3-methyltransferase (glyoxalase superfamily)